MSTIPPRGTAPVADREAARLLVLGSTSPRRHDLLGRLSVPFVIADPAVDEPDPAPGVSASRYAREMALLKGRALARRVREAAPGALPDGAVPPDVPLLDLLTADTTVECGGEILNKPVDRADALRILGKLSSSTHDVVTGFCLTRLRRSHETGGWTLAEETADIDLTRVTFRALTDSEIAEYVDSGEAYGKAGAYAAQERGDRFVERIDGDFTNVVGLPVLRIAELLAARGYHPSFPESLTRPPEWVETDAGPGAGRADDC
jgi:septum formation protein